MGTFRDLDAGPAAKGGTYRRLDAQTKKPSLADNVIGAVKSFERAIPFADEGLDSARAFLTTAADIATGKADDDIRAAIKAGRKPTDVLKERSAANLKAQRERSKGEVTDFGERHPRTKALAEGVGMALPAAAAMMTAGATALPTVAASASAPTTGGLLGGLKAVAPAVERGAVAGGLSGALAGLGGEGDLAERLDAGTVNARWGMGLGAALPPALGAMAKGVDLATRAATPAAQKEAATAGRILAARAPEALTPLPAWNANVLPFERMGRGGESLARAVGAVPGPGQEIAETVLRRRQGEAPGRMMASTLRDLGDDGTGFHPTLDQLDMKRLVESKPLYEEAFAIGPVQSTKLEDLARRPSVKDAIRKAFKLAMEEGEDARGLGLFDMENPADWASEFPSSGAAGAGQIARRGGLAKAPQGKTLIKFIADNGGVLDEGGDLAMRDPQLWNRGRAYQSRLIGEGGTPEQWAQRAWERGYFPDRQSPPSPEELFKALDDELRGSPRYARDADPRQADRVRLLDEAEEMEYRGGVGDDVPDPDDYVGRPEPRGEPVFGQVPTAKTWDYVKRGLDELIEEKRDPVTKRLPRTDTMRLMDQTRRELRGELVDLNPAYGPALAAYTGPSRAIDAAHLGRRLVTGKMDPEDVATGVGMMSKNELDALKLGMARGLADQFRGQNPQKVIRRFADDAVVQDRLRAGFNNDAAFGQFMDDVIAEAQAQTSYNRVLSGSRTTPLREDIDAANEAASGAGEIFADVMARKAGGEGFVRQGANAALRNWQRIRQPGLNNPEVSRLLGEILFKGRPVDEVLQQAVAQKHITVDEARQIANGIVQYSSQAREANREGP